MSQTVVFKDRGKDNYLKICIRPLLGGILGQGQGQDKAAQGFLFPNDFKAALFVFRWI